MTAQPPGTEVLMEFEETVMARVRIVRAGFTLRYERRCDGEEGKAGDAIAHFTGGRQPFVLYNAEIPDSWRVNSGWSKRMANKQRAITYFEARGKTETVAKLRAELDDNASVLYDVPLRVTAWRALEAVEVDTSSGDLKVSAGLVVGSVGVDVPSADAPYVLSKEAPQADLARLCQELFGVSEKVLRRQLPSSEPAPSAPRRPSRRDEFLGLASRHQMDAEREYPTPEDVPFEDLPVPGRRADSVELG